MKHSKIRFRRITLIVLGILTTVFCFGQSSSIIDGSKTNYRYAINTTWLSFSNFGNPETNTEHYELHARYYITEDDAIGIKLATWKFFAPLGIPIWNEKFLDREYFYPGRLRETGAGVIYQRKLWKELFATLEILAFKTSFLDQEGSKIQSGFKLYNSYHIGYHIPLFRKGRIFIEPQIHVNHWPINTNVLSSFKVEEDKWGNIFLIEPNIYLGIKF